MNQHTCSRIAKPAAAALTLLALVVFLSLSAQAQQKMPPPNRSLGPLAPSACDAVAGNLVVNCGFETGDFTGWNVSGFDTNHVFASGNLHTGAFAASLESVGGLGRISQTLATTPGQIYTLSFFFQNGGSPNNFQVSFGPASVIFPYPLSGELANMPDFPYTQYISAPLTGSGADVVAFCARNDPVFFVVDDIVVQ